MDWKIAQIFEDAITSLPSVDELNEYTDNEGEKHKLPTNDTNDNSVSIYEVCENGRFKLSTVKLDLIIDDNNHITKDDAACNGDDDDDNNSSSSEDELWERLKKHVKDNNNSDNEADISSSSENSDESSYNSSSSSSNESLRYNQRTLDPRAEAAMLRVLQRTKSYDEQLRSSKHENSIRNSNSDNDIGNNNNMNLNQSNDKDHCNNSNNDDMINQSVYRTNENAYMKVHQHKTIKKNQFRERMINAVERSSSSGVLIFDRKCCFDEPIPIFNVEQHKNCVVLALNYHHIRILLWILSAYKNNELDKFPFKIVGIMMCAPSKDHEVNLAQQCMNLCSVEQESMSIGSIDYCFLIAINAKNTYDVELYLNNTNISTAELYENSDTHKILWNSKKRAIFSNTSVKLSSVINIIKYVSGIYGCVDDCKCNKHSPITLFQRMPAFHSFVPLIGMHNKHAFSCDSFLSIFTTAVVVFDMFSKVGQIFMYKVLPLICDYRVRLIGCRSGIINIEDLDVDHYSQDNHNNNNFKLVLAFHGPAVSAQLQQLSNDVYISTPARVKSDLEFWFGGHHHIKESNIIPRHVHLICQPPKLHTINIAIILVADYNALNIYAQVLNDCLLLNPIWQIQKASLCTHLPQTIQNSLNVTFNSERGFRSDELDPMTSPFVIWMKCLDLLNDTQLYMALKSLFNNHSETNNKISWTLINEYDNEYHKIGQSNHAHEYCTQTVANYEKEISVVLVNVISSKLFDAIQCFCKYISAKHNNFTLVSLNYDVIDDLSGFNVNEQSLPQKNSPILYFAVHGSNCISYILKTCEFLTHSTPYAFASSVSSMAGIMHIRRLLKCQQVDYWSSQL